MLNKLRSNKWIWFCIIVLEMIFLGVWGVASRRQFAIELNFTQDDLIYNTGEAGFYLDTSFSKRYISTPELLLPKGFYTLEAECEYNGEYVRLEVVHSDGQVNSYVSDTVDFTNSYTSRDPCVFRVRYADRKIQVRGRLGGDSVNEDYILIRNIRIMSDDSLTLRYMLFQMIVFFMFVDIFLFFVLHKVGTGINNGVRSHIKVLILLIAVTCIPLMVDYLTVTSDLKFHLARIEGIKEGLLNGSFPLRLESFALHGQGYPYSIFYGDALLYIPAILRLFGVSIQAAYKFYVLLINTGTALISYYCFSKMSDNRKGLVATIVFSLNIFRLYDIYVMGAVGEYTAMTFMPLVLYGMWSIYMLPEGSKDHEKGWIPLTGGCVGVFLSHMLSTVMVAFFMIFTAIIFVKTTFRRKTFLVLMKAILSTALLCFWFLIPFIDYMLSDIYVISDFSRYVPYQLEMRGTFPAQLFMNQYSAIKENAGTGSGVASEMPLTLGWASMLALVGWFIFCFGKKREKEEKKEEFLSVFLCILCLMMTLYFFPYTWFANKLPVLRIAIYNIQFSRRFYAVAGVLMAWLLCIVLRKKWIPEKKKQIFAMVLVFIAFWQGISFMSDVLNESPVYRVFQKAPTMEIGLGDYIPVEPGEVFWVNDYLRSFTDQITYDEGVVSVSDWGRDREAVVVSLTNHTDQIQQVEVPLLNYKGYHAMADNGDELQISSGTAHRISISVPAGFSGTIRVGFSEPWYWRISELISLITLLFLLLYPCIRNHVRKRQKTDIIYEI